MRISDEHVVLDAVTSLGGSVRRRALDAAIASELQRGQRLGSHLRRHQWDLLNTLVERELQQPEPTTTESLLIAAALSGPLRGVRFARRLDWLEGAGLARRERGRVYPTVAGVAAVRPFAAMSGPHQPALAVLRRLCRAELAVSLAEGADAEAQSAA
ncbi:hypothetical protein PTQ19_03355 [Microbacterium esteraromaticum]|uniref:hypothetical protein n=1 Tax=Microbacterium esteraromaticum TaxID=57043 RepID=UPI0023688122|nr:hypothetical protein [Microbacterium esteraromaticum]WDH79492.1 hypothetical protein PTQ19_03355 [Microbacterium esteraromaticum]